VKPNFSQTQDEPEMCL